MVRPVRLPQSAERLDARVSDEMAPIQTTGTTDSRRAAPARTPLLSQLQSRSGSTSSSATGHTLGAKHARSDVSASDAFDEPAVRRPRTAAPSDNRRWTGQLQAGAARADARGRKPASSGPAGDSLAPGASASAEPSAASRVRTGVVKGSRQRVSAAMVYTILTDRAHNVLPSATAAVHSISLSTVNTWVSEKRWQNYNLAVRLSKMPDYSTYREALDGLVGRLHLTAGALPPAAAPVMTMDAAKLKAALELLLARQAIRGSGYGKGPNLLDSVGEEVGCPIRKWLSVDGRLRKPVGAVARLEGYEEHRVALQGLFERFGHIQTASALSESAERSVIRMTTALLVDALAMLAAKPDRSSAQIAVALGVDWALLAAYMAPDGGKLRDIDAVRKLPDYADRREALSGALAALGHDAQANALPLGQIDASDFLRAMRTGLDRFVAGIRQMQADPALSAHRAAVSVGVPSAAFCAIVGAGGTVRERGDVHDTLTGFRAYLAPGIDDQLDRLRAAARGKAQAPTARMTTLKFPQRGSIPARTLIVRPTTRDPGPGAKQRLSNIYADNTDLVREPRSFGDERPKQALRWLATVLREAFSDSREIQCYYDARRKAIVVSSNVTTINRDLASTLARGGLIEIIEQLCDRGMVKDSREARHLEKLLVMLQADTSSVQPRLLGEVLLAMQQARFRSPGVNFKGGVHLHAERRIWHELKGRLDRALLAGTMRPCGTCADELGFGETEPRGPFWSSQPAQAFVDTPRIIERNIADGVGTSVTKMRDEKVTADYGTDSDSDIEDTERRLAQSGRRRDI